jgi:hypothetical protein
MVGNVCMLACQPSGARPLPPSWAPAQATRPPCTSKVARSSLLSSLAPCSGAVAGLVLPCASHEGGRTAQRGEGMSSKRAWCWALARKQGTYTRCSEVIWGGFCYSLRQHKVQHPPTVLIFLERSPSGVQTRDVVVFARTHTARMAKAGMSSG